MIVFYHGDMDGIVSANMYIRMVDNGYNENVKRFLKVIEFEYDKQDLILDAVKKASAINPIVFVDCCPDEEILQQIVESQSAGMVTIIDHHISKKELIDKYIQEGLINGISYIGASAALITWCWGYFNKDIQEITYFLDKTKDSKTEQDKSPIPLAIRLVNSWDIWNKMYQDAEPYKIFFEAQDFTPIDDEIKELISSNIKIRNAIRDGNIMMQFFHNWGKIYCERYGYEVKYKTNDFFVLNVGNANSKIFGDLINNYDAVIIYCNNGVKWKCSIYSQKEDFDCAKFAEQFDGGGHKGAAGFVLKDLPVWLRDKKLNLFQKGDN